MGVAFALRIDFHHASPGIVILRLAMKQQAYKIRGMDCAEEVAVLKRALGALAGGEDRLRFDLINGKLTLEEAPVDAEAVQRAVAQTGMRAIPWEEHVRRAEDARAVSWWRREARAAFCAASGVFLTLGFLSHAWPRGIREAVAGRPDGASLPGVSLALYAAAMIAGVWFVLPKAWYSARHARPDMNLLMIAAIAGAVVLGDWFEAGSVAFLFALALLLESWSVGRARRAIHALMNLSPPIARFRCPHDGCIEEKPVGEIALGAICLVRPGERVPLDGVVTSGATAVNEAPITGESLPVEKTAGDMVFAGAINETGVIEFRVTKAAEDTTLARIIHMVEQAQSHRAPSEQWVEKFARVYTPAMMALALGVAVIPPLLGGAALGWFYQALVILVIACPCALVISTPVSIVAGLATAARHGVLIKGGAFLEAPARLRAVAFDKTGTITSGRPEVRRVIPLNGHSEAELLERAAALESHSNHPLAQAVVRHARGRGLTPGPVEDYREIPGRGAEATYRGRPFWIGSHRLLHERGLETAECHAQATALEAEGNSVIAIGNADHVCGLISIADEARPGAAEVIAALRAAGIRHIAMITGDNAATADRVARGLGLDETQANVLPEEKVDAVRRLVARFGAVAMVGDGVNDAPALAASTVGIAMGAAGSDAAIETADIALMSDDLARLPWLIGHSRRTLRIIQQNIAFALGLKLLFIALAFAGAATLWMAIAADMGASLLVIANALRLLRD
jgi:Cd2+/Zn2+-exporting ATPase